MKKANLGLSLVELMIAMLVGLILVGGVVTLFIETSANIKKTEQVSALTSEGQFALSVLAHDLAMAGFWGYAFDPADVDFHPSVFNDTSPSSTVGTDCGAAVSTNVNDTPAQNLAWAYNIRQPIEQYDNADGGETAVFTCLSDVQTGTDIIAIRRVAGRSVAPLSASAHEDNAVYLRANRSFGGLFRADTAALDLEEATIEATNGAAFPDDSHVDVVDWEYRPMIYFVRNYSRVSGDGIPTLCHKVFTAEDPNNFESECIAEGVENLQLQFGIDTDRDGTVNYFDPDPDATEITQVSAVRIHLLVRAIRMHSRFRNSSSYVMGDETVSVNDNYFRELFTQTVPIRNPSRLRAFE